MARLGKEFWLNRYMSVLNGSARSIAYNYQNQHPGITYEEVRDYLHRTLEPIADFAAEQRFENARRHGGETLRMYAARLRDLAHRSYGSSHSWEMLEHRVRQVFVRNLGGALGEQVRMKFPETVEEALGYATNFESAGVTEKQKGVIGGVVGQVVTNSSKSEKPKGNCFFCGKPGHFKKDCRAFLASNRGRGSNRSRGGQGNFSSNNLSRSQGNSNSNRGNQNRGNRGGVRGRGGRANRGGRAQVNAVNQDPPNAPDNANNNPNNNN